MKGIENNTTDQLDCLEGKEGLVSRIRNYLNGWCERHVARNMTPDEMRFMDQLDFEERGISIPDRGFDS